jgi:hypothetical protein
MGLFNPGTKYMYGLPVLKPKRTVGTVLQAVIENVMSLFTCLCNDSEESFSRPPPYTETYDYGTQYFSGLPARNVHYGWSSGVDGMFPNTNYESMYQDFIRGHVKSGYYWVHR